MLPLWRSDSVYDVLTLDLFEIDWSSANRYRLTSHLSAMKFPVVIGRQTEFANCVCPQFRCFAVILELSRLLSIVLVLSAVVLVLVIAGRDGN